jgi:hypothetical protein
LKKMFQPLSQNQVAAVRRANTHLLIWPLETVFFLLEKTAAAKYTLRQFSMVDTKTGSFLEEQKMKDSASGESNNKAPTMKANDYITIIQKTGLFNSGRRFTIEEMIRTSNHLKPLGVSRVRQILSRMADESLVNKITVEQDGHAQVEYSKRASSRGILAKRWANPVSSQYSPRWY